MKYLKNLINYFYKENDKTDSTENQIKLNKSKIENKYLENSRKIIINKLNISNILEEWSIKSGFGKSNTHSNFLSQIKTQLKINFLIESEKQKPKEYPKADFIIYMYERDLTNSNICLYIQQKIKGDIVYNNNLGKDYISNTSITHISFYSCKNLCSK